MSICELTPTQSFEELAALVVVVCGSEDFDRHIAPISQLTRSKILHIDQQTLGHSRDGLELHLIEKRSTYAKLAFVGFGDCGWEAIKLAYRCGADLAVAIAPEIPSNERVAAPSEIALSDSQVLRLYVLWGEDSNAELPLWLGNPGVSLRALQTNVPSAALPMALRHTSQLEPILELVSCDRALPDLTDLRAAWRKQLRYAFEFDDNAVYEDADGVIRLRGLLRNTGLIPLTSWAEHISIGARACEELKGGFHLEPRCRIAQPILGPGDASAFLLSVPAFSDQLSEVNIGLVCEGQFWFDWLGFPCVRLIKNEAMSVPAHLSGTSPGRAADRLCRAAMMDTVLECGGGSGLGNCSDANLDDLRNCYRLLLGREPDPPGFSAFASMIERGIPCDELVKIFFRSDEFLRRVKTLS